MVLLSSSIAQELGPVCGDLRGLWNLIEKGKGSVVTMTVTHENSHVFELELSGLDARGRAITETLCPTDVHKLYSAERGWVMTKHLRVGEVLRTLST